MKSSARWAKNDMMVWYCSGNTVLTMRTIARVLWTRHIRSFCVTFGCIFHSWKLHQILSTTANGNRLIALNTTLQISKPGTTVQLMIYNHASLYRSVAYSIYWQECCRACIQTQIKGPLPVAPPRYSPLGQMTPRRPPSWCKCSDLGMRSFINNV